MQVELSLNRAKELGVWLHERTNGLCLLSSEQKVIAGATLYLAQEHYDAIIVLFSARLYGSAFALARPLLEAYVRGTWLLNHASPDELQKYMKGDCPKFWELLQAIGDEPGTSGYWLKKIKRKNWYGFNDLTHGGACHVVRRVTEDAIESAYPEEERSRLLYFSGEVAIGVAEQLFSVAIAGKEVLLSQLEERAAAFLAQA